MKRALKTLALSVLFLGPTVSAQRPRMTIPAIAKYAHGAVVSIIMSGKEGSPIAQGSGFLISKDGFILTNYHVIESGSSAIVKLPDGAFFAVDGLLAFDKARDVAIIKAHGQNFRTLAFGNSDQLQVGEEVVAIGNPLSLESTVSNGIISGIRTVEAEGGKFLQVTTPISPGSSGGPLFNMAGEVVGITTLYLKGGENLNFAIPINDAKRLLLSNSSKVQALPNETEPVKAQTHEAGANALAEATKWISKTFNGSTGQIMCFDIQRTMIGGEGHAWSAWDVDNAECHYISYSIHFEGCSTIIVQSSRQTKGLNDNGVQETNTSRLTFDLHEIDPSSIKLEYVPDSLTELKRSATFDTTNDEDAITKEFFQGNKFGHAMHVWGIAPGLVMMTDYAPRFIKAFRTAIESCGGKPSAF